MEKVKKQNYHPQLQESRSGLTQGSTGKNPMREEGSRKAGWFLSRALSKRNNSYVQEERQPRRNWNTKRKSIGSGSRVRPPRRTVETLSARAGMRLGKWKLSRCWIWIQNWTGEISTDISAIKGSLGKTCPVTKHDRISDDKGHRRGWGTTCLFCLNLYWYDWLSGVPGTWDQGNRLEHRWFIFSGEGSGLGTFKQNSTTWFMGPDGIHPWGLREMGDVNPYISHTISEGSLLPAETPGNW